MGSHRKIHSKGLIKNSEFFFMVPGTVKVSPGIVYRLILFAVRNVLGHGIWKLSKGKDTL